MKLFDKIRISTNTKKSDFELGLINRRILFLLILTISTCLQISVNAQSWLDYNYRRALTITNSGSTTLTNYQVLIKLDSTNFTGHYPRPNGEDIRVTSADGTTLLPYWIESWSSNKGVIWTKIPSLPVGTTTIYIYYGNATDTSISSGANTFEIFEDDWLINPVHTSMQPSWEHSVTFPNVFREPDSTTFYMTWDGHRNNGSSKGLSRSTDLFNWIPDANNPIMGFDTLGVDHGGNGIFAWGDIIKVGSTYHMFVAKGPTFTYHAQSTDLIDWTGMNNSPNFDSLISDISVGITTGATILKEGDGITPVVVDGRYWMVYGFKDFYMAWSTDLINWHDANNGNPFLVTTDTTQWDRYMWTPSFVRVAGNYYIYYQGSNEGHSPWYIGFASAPATNAPNLVTWTKAGDPLIGPNNGWELDAAAIDPVFRFFDGTYYLFYTGGQNNGFATSSNPEGPWSQNNKWIKDFRYHPNGLSYVSNGIIHIDDAQSVTTRNSFSIGHAVGFRAYFHSNITGYKWGGFSIGETAPYVAYQVDTGNPNNLTFIANDSLTYPKILKLLPPNTLGAFNNYEATWSPSLGQAFINHSFGTNITAQIPVEPMPLNFQNLYDTTTTFDLDWVYARKFNYPDPAITTVGTEQPRPVYVNAKVFLEGPYSGGGAMTTSLNSIIPLNSNVAYPTATYGYTASTVGSIPNATIVDWVLVELRTGTAANTKVATRAAFLKSDGTIVDVDGTSLLNFAGLAAAGNYYIVVRHRTHLAIMSANAIALGLSSSPYDFTTAQAQAYGTNPMIALSGGGFGMIGADGNRDGGIYAEDYTLYRTSQGNEGYLSEDYNLDGGAYAEDYTLYRLNQGSETNVP